MDYLLRKKLQWRGESEKGISKIHRKVKMKHHGEKRKAAKYTKINRKKIKRNRMLRTNVAFFSIMDIRTLSKLLYHKLCSINNRSSINVKDNKYEWRNNERRPKSFQRNSWLFILVLLQELSVIFCGNVPIMSTRIVETRYGKLQGMIYPMDHTKHLKPVEVFLGIPYATPPVRSNRFSPTRTPSPWEGVRVADKLGPVCPQKLPDIKNETAALERMPKGRLEYLKRLLPLLKNQSEDCLYLNIYSPAQAGTTEHMVKHPVLVFIHGESYDWNSGNPYDGSVIASYAELVVVTLNYRLGILGFLNANIAPHLKARVANYGLMDQIAALHWIQQNIGLFGGDPGNVTLLGHGTGAACIHFLMISPTVMPGLFHRSILLSGSALSSWALVEDPVSFATKLARQVNCTLPQDLLREHEKIVDCLREVPLEELQKADVLAPTYLSAFGPSVDGVVIKTDFQKDMLTYFVPGDVPVGYASFSGSGNVVNKRSEASMLGIPTTGTNRYDLLFGVVTSEALFRFSAADVSSGFEGERRDKIIRTYVRNAYTYHLSEIFYTVVNEYTDWERTVLHPINTRDAAIAALGDAQFVAPLVRTGDLLSARGSASNGGPGTKTWFYVFDYQTKDGDYPQRMGTAHGEELPYVFGAPLIDGFNHFPRNYTKSEVTLSEAVIIYISNFVRTGNPNDHQRTDGSWNTRERSRFRNIVWDEYDSVHQKYLEMGMKPRMKNHFRAHQLSVWLRLIPELHRAGMEDVVARHNLFRNHNDHDLYDGIVRPDPLSRTNSGLYYNSDMNQDYIFTNAGVLANTGRRHHHGNNANNDSNYASQPMTTPETLLTTCVSVINSYPAATHHLGHQNSSDPLANLEAAGYAAYSTALSVTIAIGCSLLILNVLIFAGVYYQRDKTRLEVKSLQQNQRSSVNYDVKPGHYHIGSGSVIVDLEQDTANMILCQNQQRDSSNILLCQNQARYTNTATIPRTSPSHCIQSNTGTMTIKKPTPDISRNPEFMMKNPDLRNPDIVKNNPVTSAGILMNTNKSIEMNHIPNSKSSALSHMATLPKNMTFCNNVATSNMNETVVSPPNGSATMHMSLPRPPPPPVRSPPESQPLLPPKQHPPGSLRVPAAAMNEMRV